MTNFLLTYPDGLRVHGCCGLFAVGYPSEPPLHVGGFLDCVRFALTVPTGRPAA